MAGDKIEVLGETRFRQKTTATAREQKEPRRTSLTLRLLATHVVYRMFGLKMFQSGTLECIMTATWS